jgi:hypothetical protein
MGMFNLCTTEKLMGITFVVVVVVFFFGSTANKNRQ